MLSKKEKTIIKGGFVITEDIFIRSENNKDFVAEDDLVL